MYVTVCHEDQWLQSQCSMIIIPEGISVMDVLNVQKIIVNVNERVYHEKQRTLVTLVINVDIF